MANTPRFEQTNQRTNEDANKNEPGAAVSAVGANAESDELPALVCPRDGTILDLSYRVRPGRFECPACRSILAAHSVVIGA